MEKKTAYDNKHYPAIAKGRSLLHILSHLKQRGQEGRIAGFHL